MATLPFNDTVLDPGRSLLQGLMAGQQMREGGIRNQILQEQLAQQQQATQMSAQQRDIQMLGMIAQGLEGVPQENQQAVYSSMLGAAKNLGFDVSDAPEQLDSDTVNQLMMAKRLAFGDAKEQGLVKVGAGETLYDPRSRSAIYTAPKTEDDEEFLKEQRKIAYDSVRGIDKRAGEIRTAIGKVRGLEGQMKSKNRQAIAAGVMNVARLISPGVVTDVDFQNLSGAQNPLALAFDVISGRSPDIAKQLNRYVDPTNPDVFDVEGLMAVAEAVASSEAPVILDQYGQAKSQAERAGLKSKAIDTIFGSNPNIESLNEFSSKKGGSRLDELRKKHGL